MPTSLRPRLRAGGAAAGRWLRASSYLQRWLVLGAGIGVIAGPGAVVFYAALRAGDLAGAGGGRARHGRARARPRKSRRASGRCLPARSICPRRTAGSASRSRSARASARSSARRWAVPCWPPSPDATSGPCSPSSRTARRRSAADATAPTVSDQASLDDAVDALPAVQPWLPVLDQQRRVVGILAITDIVRGYRDTVTSDARQLSAVASNAATFDLVVAGDSAMIGRPLRNVSLPDGTIVLTLKRADDLLGPSADLELAGGDVLTVLARPDRMAAINVALGAQ